MSERPAIYLDAEDEITTVIARLRRAQGDVVVLVLPPGSRLGTSRINFRLLAREAHAAGKRLEIVAPDAGARAVAAAAGLAARATLDGGASPPSGGGPARPEGGPSPLGPAGDRPAVPRVGRQRPVVPGRVALVAALLVAVAAGAIGFAAFRFLPTAAITITPAVEPVGPLELVVTADPAASAPDPATMTIPAVRIPYDAAVRETFTATGVKVVETKATGTVTFANCYPNADIPLKTGTLVRTAGGVGFRLTGPVTVSRAVKLGNAITCSTADAAIEADQAGDGGNVPAGAIDQPPAGYDPTFVTVTNDQATTGGTHVESPQVSQEDVDTALAALGGELTAALAARLDEVIGAAATGTTVFRETARTADPVPDVDPATLAGLEATSFQLGLSATGSVLSVDPGPVAQVARVRLLEQVPAGWTLVDGSLALVPGSPSVAGDTVDYPVEVRASRIRTVDGPSLLAQVLGLDLPQARAVLDDYGAVTIDVWPDWVTTVPTNGRSSLTVATSAASASPAPDGSSAP